MRKSLITICFLTVAQGAFAQDNTEAVSSNPGTDATDVSQAARNHPYRLPDGYHAQITDYSLQAGLANRSLISDLSLRSDYSAQAGEAETADLSLDSLALDGHNSSFYRNASNINFGQLSLDRLVGSILDSNYKIVNSLLSGQTYDINITGSSNTASFADRADEATRAQSAVICTGGPSGCDY